MVTPAWAIEDLIRQRGMNTATDSNHPRGTAAAASI
jgi:hypothetical protein